MIYDLQTGEAYDAILYQDAASVVFWTQPGGASQARESFTDAGQLVKPLALTDEGGVAWATVARFQVLDDGARLHAEFHDRQAQLASYATANGGQILVHQPEERTTGLDRLARWGRGLLAGPAD
jgi:hypothetical protein